MPYGRMRNWNIKTASARTAPRRIYGRMFVRTKILLRKWDAVRADAELE